MKNYRYLLFDADHTLLDYGADEISALTLLHAEFGLPTTAEAVDFSHHASERVWTKAGLYEVDNPKIQREYHTLYRWHVTGLFEEVFEKFGCKGDPKKAGERFIKLLEKGGRLRENAEQVLQKLSQKSGGRYEVSILTNGLSKIQRARLRGLEKYVNEIFISEELGVIKPMPAFFEKTLSALGGSADECLMIGDSFTSDILGAHAVGMDGCWLRSRTRVEETPIQPTFTIRNLSELLQILQ